MAKQLITIGTPGAGGGEPAHAAFKKINDNTNEVYSFLGADGSGVLTAEGAREALGIYSKDEVYSREEVYSKGEANDLIENANFASLETNTFNGHQTMNAGASVTGDFTVNGINLLAAFTGAHGGSGYQLIPNPNEPSKPLIVRWGAGSKVGDGTNVVGYSHTFPAAFPNNCYRVFCMNRNYVKALLTAETWSQTGFGGYLINDSLSPVEYHYIAIGD